MKTRRFTMAQALVTFLKNQYVSRDGREIPFFAGAWGIFGHGNVAGVAQALQQTPNFPYYLSRNEQAMVHASIGFAKASNRLRTFACTSSIGPGATNMVTGAAAATINRLPVLLLPGDIFARRNVAPVLQQLEFEHTQDISVNNAFQPVSRYWDRINRPDQLPFALMEAMRVLTSPAETGAVTLALPQDVQAERGWQCLRVVGLLDFSTVGVIASLTGVLAVANISVFVVSTFDTDYLFVKEGDLEAAVDSLNAAGHAVSS